MFRREKRHRRIPYQRQGGIPHGAAHDRFVQPLTHVPYGAEVQYRVAERIFSFPRLGIWHDKTHDYTHEIQLWEDVTDMYDDTESRMIAAKWCYAGMGTGGINASREYYAVAAHHLNAADMSTAVNGMFVSYYEAGDQAVMTLKSVRINDSFWASVAVTKHQCIVIPDIKAEDAVIRVADAKAELHELRDDLHTTSVMQQLKDEQLEQERFEDEQRAATLKAIATS